MPTPTVKRIHLFEFEDFPWFPAWLRACLTRLDLTGRAVPVVLGGGILQAGHARLLARISRGVAALAPEARPVVLTEPPIAGAALLALAGAGGSPEALARARLAFG